MLVYIVGLLLVRATEGIYKEYVQTARGNLNFPTLFQYGTMRTVYTTRNESRFFHLEQDLTNNNVLLICLDNGVSTIDVRNNKTAGAYAGDPGKPGYNEGIRHLARFRTVTSLAQINDSVIVVSDKFNFCLRKIDRSTGMVSEYVGRCTEQASEVNIQSGASTLNNKLLSPGALLFDKRTKMLYAVDTNRVHHINTETLIVQRISYQGEENINSIIVSPLLMTAFLGTTDAGIVAINEGITNAELISGKAIAGVETVEGNLTEATFNEPRVIIHLFSNLYLTAEYGAHRLRGLDLNSGKSYSLCSGEGYLDGSVKDCKLYQPISLAVINYTVYVGEIGSYQGGLRAIDSPAVTEVEGESKKSGIVILVMVCSLTSVACVMVTMARFYTAKIKKEEADEVKLKKHDGNKVSKGIMKLKTSSPYGESKIGSPMKRPIDNSNRLLVEALMEQSETRASDYKHYVTGHDATTIATRNDLATVAMGYEATAVAMEHDTKTEATKNNETVVDVEYDTNTVATANENTTTMGFEYETSTLATGRRATTVVTEHDNKTEAGEYDNKTVTTKKDSKAMSIIGQADTAITIDGANTMASTNNISIRIEKASTPSSTGNNERRGTKFSE